MCGTSSRRLLCLCADMCLLHTALAERTLFWKVHGGWFIAETYTCLSVCLAPRVCVVSTTVRVSIGTPAGVSEVLFPLFENWHPSCLAGQGGLSRRPAADGSLQEGVSCGSIIPVSKDTVL